MFAALLTQGFVPSANGAVVDGTLDTSFSEDGIISAPLPIDEGIDDYVFSEAQSVVVDSLGRIIVAGYAGRVTYPSTSPSVSNFVVARYTKEGDLDTRFSEDGIVTTEFIPGRTSLARDLAIDSQGRIIVVGTSESGSGYLDIAVARYTDSGDLDFSFSEDGKTTISIYDQDLQAYSVSIVATDQIVVVGSKRTDEGDIYFIAKFKVNGDLLWSKDGSITLSDSEIPDPFYITECSEINPDDLVRKRQSVAKSTALDSNGNVIVVGFHTQTCYDNSEEDDVYTAEFVFLARYTNQGNLDPTFGQDGMKIANLEGMEENETFSLAVNSVGKIVVATSERRLGKWVSTLLAFNADGSVDETFGTLGKVNTEVGLLGVASEADTGLNYLVNGMTIDSEDRIVTTGYRTKPATTPVKDVDGVFFNYSFFQKEFALARYEANGTLDSSFDTDGIVISNLGVLGIAQLLTYDDDGYAIVIPDSGGKRQLQAVTNGARISHVGMSVAIKSTGEIIVTGTSIFEENINNTGVYVGKNFTIVQYNSLTAADTSGDDAAIAEAARVAAIAEAARVAAIAEAARVAAIAEAARQATAAAAAKQQRELTEILSIIPSLGSLALNLGETTKVLTLQKCVKKKQIKYVKKGAKCPKGFVRKR